MLLGRFLRSCFSLISRRIFLFVLMNTFYFGFIVVGAFLAQFQSLPLYEWSFSEEVFIGEWGLPVMILVIFLFNLVVSGFFLVTLTGMVFFGLSVAVLLMRAVFWGALLNQLPTPQFLLVLPTLVLEGGGYVFASVAGVVLGLSWLKTDWLYENEDLSRWEAFKMACRECIRLYVFVALFLFMAAIVEAVTITWLT